MIYLIFLDFILFFFWDGEFCEEKLKISLTELKNTIENDVEYLEFFKNGIFVIVSSKLLTLEEANKVDVKLKNLFSSLVFTNAQMHYEF